MIFEYKNKDRDFIACVPQDELITTPLPWKWAKKNVYSMLVPGELEEGELLLGELPVLA